MEASTPLPPLAQYQSGRLFALLLVGAGRACWGRSALTAPTVLQVTPADGTADANPAAGVQIVFSQWVRPGLGRQSAVAFDPPVEFASIAREASRELGPRDS